MKKAISLLVVTIVVLCVSAQETKTFRFGCISYEMVLLSMPEYSQVDNDLNALKANYDAEMKASEEEFNAKYETFLNEYENYAPSILRKRQSELEDIMRRNELFRLESIRLLEQAREEMMEPVREKLNAAIADVATKYSLAFVLNIDSNAVPFMNSGMAYNITKAVQDVVGNKD